MSAIECYLKTCRELARFCSRNGWIDNASLHYAVAWEGDNAARVDIEFDELLMEGGAHQPVRVSCCGQMRLFLDHNGRVISSEIL
ncbi:MAG: hypothetical protein OEU44_08720 [Gammaproteobacteria bacterium]|nr:hypothetical protein [Gammaproteobacteria bacterium]